MLRGVVTNVSGCSWLLFMVLKLNAAPVVNPIGKEGKRL